MECHKSLYSSTCVFNYVIFNITNKKNNDYDKKNVDANLSFDEAFFAAVNDFR